MRYTVGGVSFTHEDGTLRFADAFGLYGAGAINRFRAGGLFDILLDDQPVNTDYLPAEVSLDGGALNAAWTLPCGAVLALHVEADADSGVARVDAKLTNINTRALTLRRAALRLALDSGDYAFYAQAGGWSRENRGAWRRFEPGEMTMRGRWGRSTADASPYCALRDEASGLCVAFHLLPECDWRISLGEHADLNEPTSLTLGSDELNLSLAPGESYALPSALLHAAEGIDLSGWRVQRYFNRRLRKTNIHEPKLVYNTWFFEFPVLNVPKLREQLAAAKRAGCEVYVIDAGWFGLATAEDWPDQGDWREKTQYAFKGEMRAFADEVRAAGLEFGLWMEAEQARNHTPVRVAHPDWFVDCDGASSRWKLEDDEPYQYLKSEIYRLIDTYGLTWMKLDFNMPLRPLGDGLAKYFARWYQLLDELRRDYPGFNAEGCSSGAMRFDLAAQVHYDGHFISDNVNPYDVVRISQGAMLRLPPGQIERWATLRGVSGIPEYPLAPEKSPVRTLTPEGAIWNRSVFTDIRFPLALGAMGILGYTGDLASLSDEQMALCCEASAFYKANRAFLHDAEGRLLTPPDDLEKRIAWAAFQLTNGSRHLVYAFRMTSLNAGFTIVPRALKPEARYRVSRVFSGACELGEADGASLMATGWRVRHGSFDEAAIYEFKEIES